MKIYTFVVLLFLCVACSKVRTENDFYDDVVKEFASKPSPQKTVLGIDYSMAYDEMMEYLFFLGETNDNVIGGADDYFFLEEVKGKTKEEKRQIYLSDYKNEDVKYRIQSEKDSYFLLGDISVVDPTNIRYGILIIFKDKVEKVDEIVYPIYLKKYGQPIFISKDEKKHVWIDGSQLVEYVKEKNDTYVMYSDAVLFANEFKKIKSSSKDRHKEYSKDL